MDAKSRPTFKEIVQQLEEAFAFPLTANSSLSGSRRCPVVTTRSNPCSTAMVEARSEEFLLQSDGPEENNHKKCNTIFLTLYYIGCVLLTSLYTVCFNYYTMINEYYDNINMPLSY